MADRDLLDLVIAEVRRIGARLGVAIRIDDRDDPAAHPAEVGIGKTDEWDRLFTVRMDPLPGGTGHMAHVRVATAPAERMGSVDAVQVERMLETWRHRKARVDAIVAAGLDPMDPPLWSLYGLKATRSMLEAIADGSLKLARAKSTSTGTIILKTDGAPTPDFQIVANDHLVTSPDIGGWHPMLEGGLWRYAVSEKGPQITIYAVNLPETAINAVLGGETTVARLVDDEVLSRLDVPVVAAENLGRNLILRLANDREWHAPVPAGLPDEWREGLS